MSTLKFLRDHPPHKKGEVASVPFLKANELVAAGVAVRPLGDPTGAAPAPEPKADAELEAARKRVAELEKENADLHAQVQKLKGGDGKK